MICVSIFYSILVMRCNTDGWICLAKFISRTFLVQYEQCDQEIAILSLSLKTKKHLLCILLIVLSLIFVWRQRSFLLIFCLYCFFSLCVFHQYFLNFFKFWFVNTYIPGKNRRGGGRWLGTTKNGTVFICSFAHLLTFIFLWIDA